MNTNIIKKLLCRLSALALALIPCAEVQAQAVGSFVSNGTTFYYNRYNEICKGDIAYSGDVVIPAEAMMPGTSKWSGLYVQDGWDEDGDPNYVTKWYRTYEANAVYDASVSGQYKYTCYSPGANGSTVLRCTFRGQITFKVVSNGESYNDYLTVGQMDQACTRYSYQTSLRGMAGQTKTLTYTPSDGEEHFVEFCYSKNGSGDTSPDNATVYISQLNSIMQPVQAISYDAFRYCTNLTSVTIPGTVTRIGSSDERDYGLEYNTFSGCTSLRKVVFEDGNQPLNVYVGAGFDEEMSYYINNARLFKNAAFEELYLGRDISVYGYGADGDDYWTVTGYLTNNALDKVTFGPGLNRVRNEMFTNNINSLYLPELTSWCNVSFDNVDYNPIHWAQNVYYKYIDDNDETISRYETLEHIVLPRNLISIQGATFYGATSLESVAVQFPLGSVHRQAFYGCTNLKTIYNNASGLTLTMGSTNYGYLAYYATRIYDGDYQAQDHWVWKHVNGVPHVFICTLFDNGDITSPIHLQFPESIDGQDHYTIDGSIFSEGVLPIEHITLPRAVTEIPASFCKNQTNLQYLTIEGDVTSIGNEAFRGCQLSSLTLPESLTSIGNSAFRDCRLSSVVIPENVQSIGTSVFAGNTALHTVQLPSTWTNIPSSCFAGCTSLQYYEIPQNITSINNQAFDGCRNLLVTIHEDVTSIGRSAFQNVQTVVYKARNSTYGGNSSNKGIVAHHLTVCAEVENVPDNLFGTCESVRVISDNVTINKDVFPGVQTLSVQSNVTSISDNAFSGATSLVSAEIPNVTSIGEGAFSGCSNLQSMFIGGVSEIRASVFQNCSNLQSINLNDNITSIGDYAFAGCSGLKLRSLPNSVTSIGNYAFQNCTGLQEMTLPVALTSIANSVFENCSGLESVAIPASITSIGQNAFYNCSSLEAINIPAAVTSIGTSAFSNLGRLQELDIESNATLPANVFNGTTAKSLTLGEEITSIPSLLNSLDIETLKFNARRCATSELNLSAMSNFTAAYVGDEVQIIPDNLFANCSGLNTVVLGKNLKLIGSNAFNGSDNIRIINARSTTPPSCLTHFPVPVYMDAELVVPGVAMSAYKSAPMWSTFFNITTNDVIAEPDVMSINRETLSIEIMEAIQLTVKLGNDVLPATSLTWTSADESIATVNNNGLVTGIAPGRTTITATKEDGESISCSVNVKDSQFANLDDYLTISPVSVPRNSSATIPVYMENLSRIVGFQCDIVLPEGVTIAEDSRGKFAFTFGDRTDVMCHTMASREQADGSVRVLVFSTNNYAFEGNTGVLFNIPVEIGREVGVGDLQYSIKNIILSGEHGTRITPINVTADFNVSSITPSDANGDSNVDIADVVAVVDYILGAPSPTFVFSAADVNHDGSVDIADVVLLVDEVLNQESNNAPARIRRQDDDEDPIY